MDFSSINEVLEAVKAHLRETMADATYKTYIDGDKLTVISFENSQRVVLGTKNEWFRGILTDRYRATLAAEFEAVLGFAVDIDIVVKPAEEKPEVPPTIYPAGNYEYTFENFIVGPSNDLAVAAAKSVANNPGSVYNPLFIYGDSGLGKTHLLNAIQQQIKVKHPDSNILYTSCETFTNEIISAIYAGTTEQFRLKYRRVDLLLVDDIQFIAGKESTQEEFFYTFNELYNAGKQIVIASDRPAKDIKSLSDRLRTRFESGLTVDITQPVYETRVAIIKRKAELLQLALPDDVVDYIAANLKTNIRQLEGAVKKMNAYYRLEGIKPVTTVAQNAIRDILSETQPVPLTIEKILNEVSRTYKVSPEDIRGESRQQKIGQARMAAAYIIRQVCGLSLSSIGEELGGRDHSTMVYLLKTVETKMENDNVLRTTIEDIIKNVRP